MSTMIFEGHEVEFKYIPFHPISYMNDSYGDEFYVISIDDVPENSVTDFVIRAEEYFREHILKDHYA